MNAAHCRDRKQQRLQALFRFTARRHHAIDAQPISGLIVLDSVEETLIGIGCHSVLGLRIYVCLPQGMLEHPNVVETDFGTGINSRLKLIIFGHIQNAPLALAEAPLNVKLRDRLVYASARPRVRARECEFETSAVLSEEGCRSAGRQESTDLGRLGTTEERAGCWKLSTDPVGFSNAPPN